MVRIMFSTIVNIAVLHFCEVAASTSESNEVALIDSISDSAEKRREVDVHHKSEGIKLLCRDST